MTHKATFYLQLEAVIATKFDFQRREQVEQVQSIKATAITQSRPKKPRSGAVITKLTVEVPDGAFLPLRPEAIIVIPEGMTEQSPIVVEAVDPSDGCEGSSEQAS